MSITILDAEPLCRCGNLVQVTDTGGWGAQAYRARCSGCYDPTEGGGERSALCGFGPTPEAAMLAWEEANEELLGDEPLVLPDLFGELTRQVSEESELQRGWVKAGGAMHGCPVIFYGPEAP